MYDFLGPGRVVFGWGRRSEAGKWARTLGRRAFLITGSRTLESSGVVGELSQLLRAEGVEPVRLAQIDGEPQVHQVDQAAESLREAWAAADDLVLAIGGGSAIDLAKAAAALATNQESPTVLDYLEGVGRGLVLSRQPLPLMVMPTTAGTGSEATRNAVISSYDSPFKKSLRSDLLLPRIVLIDPELTVSLSPQTTTFTGMDAITQLLESYLSRRARPIPQALALAGLAAALPALPEAVRNGHSRAAREAMAHAALLSGIALANSGLGMAHGVAAALGVHGRVPHGLACAVMLPVALRVNRAVCEERMAQIARRVTGKAYPSEAAAADDLVALVERLCGELGIPRRLSELGFRAEQVPEIVRASGGNSMSGNPRELSDEELKQILEEML